MSLRRTVELLIIAGLSSASCTSDSIAPPVPATVALANAGGGVLLFSLGATYQLRAAVLDRNGDTITAQTVTWSSSNPAVATVSGTGLVLAVANPLAATQGAAPDVVNLSASGGPTLLNASFAVHPFRPYQSYPAPYPTDGSAPPNNARHTGALATDALGYDMDAVYRLTFTFSHSQPTVAFRFTAPALQAIEDESWGLDNVEVRVGRRP